MALADQPDSVRPDPLPFPPTTSVRFAVLVLLMLATTLRISGRLPSYLVPGIQQHETTFEQCLEAPREDVEAPQVLQDLSILDKLHKLNAYSSQIIARSARCAILLPSQVPWQLGGLGLLCLVAGVLYGYGPSWRRRHWGLQPLTTANTPSGVVPCLQELCQQAKLRTWPQFLVDARYPPSEPLAFGNAKQTYIALPAPLIFTKFTNDREAFCTLVAHELAHLKHADVHLASGTTALWWAFVVTVLLPYGLLILRRGPSVTVWQVHLQIVALVGFVYLTRNALLRLRELCADADVVRRDALRAGLERAFADLTAVQPWQAVRAHVLALPGLGTLLMPRRVRPGEGPGLDHRARADTPPARSRLRSWHGWRVLYYVMHHHPDPLQRRHALVTSRHLFHPSVCEAVGVGLAAALLVDSLSAVTILHVVGARPATVEAWSTARALWGLWPTIAVRALALALPISAVGLSLWRTIYVLGEARPVRQRLDAVAWGLAGGLFLGYLMSLYPDRYDDLERFWRVWQIPRPSGVQVASYRLVLGVCLGVSMLVFVRWWRVSVAAWIASSGMHEAHGTTAQADQALRRVRTIGMGVGLVWFTWWLAPLVAFCIKESDGMRPHSGLFGLLGPVEAVAIELAGAAGVLVYHSLIAFFLVQHLGLWISPLILVGSVGLWVFPLATWWRERQRVMGETAPGGQRPLQTIRPGFAVLMGCLGGLLFSTVLSNHAKIIW